MDDGRWESGLPEIASAIGTHLLNYARQEDYQLFYWREANDEVDFVLQYRGKVLLISADGLFWQELLSINPVALF